MLDKLIDDPGRVTRGALVLVILGPDLEFGTADAVALRSNRTCEELL